jgi:hypothetical protein
MVRSLFLVLVATVMFDSCKNCPPNEYLGEVYLSNSTLCFFPYNINDTVLMFMNSNGQVVTLKSEGGIKIEKPEIVVGSPCSRDLLDATYISMTTERREIIFSNDSVRLSLCIQFCFQNGIRTGDIDTNWVEVAFCTVGNSYNNLIDKSFSKITNDRGKEVTRIEFNSFLYSETINLLGQNYEEVYSDSLSQEIFFNKELGIIGFSYNGLSYSLMPYNL